MTSAGNLPSKYVVHVVGPVYSVERAEECHELLKSGVLSAINKAHELNAQSISIPAISSGRFHFPKDKCAEILIINAVLWALK